MTDNFYAFEATLLQGKKISMQEYKGYLVLSFKGPPPGHISHFRISSRFPARNTFTYCFVGKPMVYHLMISYKKYPEKTMPFLLSHRLNFSIGKGTP